MAKFEKGHPGGPGRPRGGHNRSALMREAIAKAIGPADGVAVLRALMKKARKGDVPAARLMLPHIWSAGTYVRIDLPAVTDSAGIAKAQAHVLAAASNEELSLEQAGQYSDLIENRRRALETVEIERNLRQANDNLAAREETDKERQR